MGASGWHYTIPYHENIDLALKELREDVFRQTPMEKFGTMGQIRAMQEMLSTLNPAFADSLKERMSGLESRSNSMKPDTIDELLEQCGEGGTHTILDIDHVADAPDFGAMSPVSDEILIEQFGTTQPTVAMIDPDGKSFPCFEDEYKRWQAVYVILYDDGAPSRIYIEGASGD